MRRVLLVLGLLLLAASATRPTRLAHEPKVMPPNSPTAGNVCTYRGPGGAGGVDEWGWSQDNAIFIRIPGPDDHPVNFSAVIMCP
jgi:hypothetical protein